MGSGLYVGVMRTASERASKDDDDIENECGHVSLSDKRRIEDSGRRCANVHFLATAPAFRGMVRTLITVLRFFEDDAPVRRTRLADFARAFGFSALFVRFLGEVAIAHSCTP